MLCYFHLVFQGHNGFSWTHSVSFVSYVRPNTLFYLSAGVNIRSHSSSTALQVCYRQTGDWDPSALPVWNGQETLINVMKSRLGLHNPPTVPPSKRQCKNCLGTDNRKLLLLSLLWAFLSAWDIQLHQKCTFNILHRLVCGTDLLCLTVFWWSSSCGFLQTITDLYLYTDFLLYPSVCIHPLQVEVTIPLL